MNKNPEEVDQRSADMWSFAIVLWEMTTREVPFVDMPPMEVGMKVKALRHLLNVYKYQLNLFLTVLCCRCEIFFILKT